MSLVLFVKFFKSPFCLIFSSTLVVYNINNRTLARFCYVCLRVFNFYTGIYKIFTLFTLRSFSTPLESLSSLYLLISFYF